MLGTSPLTPYLMMAKLVAILMLIGVLCYQSSQIHKWHTQSDKQAAGRLADRAVYEAAQKAAEAKNKADVQRIEAEQEKINHDSQSNLADRLELIRRELLKPQAAGGSAGGSSVSQNGKTPCRAFDQAWMCVSPEERLHAAESEERHDELIDWVTRQSEVR